MGEEKSRREVTSQTVEEAQDGVEEATVGDSEVESVKERYKEPPGKGNFHKRGMNEEPVSSNIFCFFFFC